MTPGALQLFSRHLAAYEAAHGELTESGVEGFYQYCQAILQSTTHHTELSPGPPRPNLPSDTRYSLVARLIMFLYRYARYYTKRVLEGQTLQTLDEFIYVAHLIDQPGMSKAELTDANIHERTTGMEIITRLLKRGLVAQTGSTRDRRERVLNVTDKGKNALADALPGMSHLARHICGDLSDEEVVYVGHLLGRLDAYHNPIFQERQAAELVAGWDGEVVR